MIIYNNHFVEINYRLGEVPVKILIFIEETGIYKIIFENNISWFAGKEIRCRINILKPLNNNDNNKRENSDGFIKI